MLVCLAYAKVMLQIVVRLWLLRTKLKAQRIPGPKSPSIGASEHMQGLLAVARDIGSCVLLPQELHGRWPEGIPRLISTSGSPLSRPG